MESNPPPAPSIANFRRSSRNRESNDDLVALESELRRAYMAKELETQLLEQQTERYIQNVRKQRASKQQLLQQQAIREEELLEKQFQQQKSVEYRAELASQIHEKLEEKKLMMEEARVEREVLTEVDRIREYSDRVKAEEAKAEETELVRRQNLILEEMREIHRQEDAEAEEKKLKEDESYLEEVAQRRSKLKQLLSERNERKERVASEIGKILMAEETEKREREVLMIELMTEDLRRELTIKDEEERQRRRRTREELAAELEKQIVFTEECKLRFLEQDKAFAEEVMKRIMEDERIAVLTNEARKRMQAKYKDDLEGLIETRRAIRRREMRKMEEEAKQEEEKEKERLERVQEERKRLLEEHVKNISEYIDKKTLTREEMKILDKIE